jgi:hypothetical protein
VMCERRAQTCQDSSEELDAIWGILKASTDASGVLFVRAIPAEVLGKPGAGSWRGDVSKILDFEFGFRDDVADLIRRGHAGFRRNFSAEERVICTLRIENSLRRLSVRHDLVVDRARPFTRLTSGRCQHSSDTHLASGLQEGGENANIDAGLGVVSVDQLKPGRTEGPC